MMSLDSCVVWGWEVCLAVYFSVTEGSERVTSGPCVDFFSTTTSGCPVVIVMAVVKETVDGDECWIDWVSPSVGSTDIIIGSCPMGLGFKCVGGSYSKILSTKTHLRPAVQRAKLSRQARMGRMQILSECRQLLICSISMHTQQVPGKATIPKAPKCSPSPPPPPPPSAVPSAPSSPLSPAVSVSSGFSSGTCPVSGAEPVGEADPGGQTDPAVRSSIPSVILSSCWIKALWTPFLLTQSITQWQRATSLLEYVFHHEAAESELGLQREVKMFFRVSQTLLTGWEVCRHPSAHEGQEFLTHAFSHETQSWVNK